MWQIKERGGRLGRKRPAAASISMSSSYEIKGTVVLRPDPRVQAAVDFLKDQYGAEIDVQLDPLGDGNLQLYLRFFDYSTSSQEVIEGKLSELNDLVVYDGHFDTEFGMVEDGEFVMGNPVQRELAISQNAREIVEDQVERLQLADAAAVYKQVGKRMRELGWTPPKKDVSGSSDGSSDTPSNHGTTDFPTSPDST